MVYRYRNRVATESRLTGSELRALRLGSLLTSMALSIDSDANLSLVGQTR